ncbi:MAG: sensor histidine kinase N-terminal domain-containing protein [Comamonadaceae bacterium]|nr:sensor histidine kinase N-terminal domain-containing protein [Comamonadaceae bacterium]
MSVTLTFVVAQGIANPPYDRKLAETRRACSPTTSSSPHGTVQLKLGIDVGEVLRADATVTTSYMVLGLRGELVAGDTDIPLPADEDHSAGPAAGCASTTMNGAEVRVAYTWARLGATPGRRCWCRWPRRWKARTQLANEIIKGVIVPQFVVLPVAVLLVWLALTRGLAPLTALQARIRAPTARRPLADRCPRARPRKSRRWSSRSTTCWRGCRRASRCRSASSPTPRTR